MKIVKKLKVGLAAAAGIAAIAAAGYFLTPDTRVAQLCASDNSVQTDSSGIGFYLDADKRLIAQYEATGDSKYLKNIGTFEAAREVWGEGP